MGKILIAGISGNVGRTAAKLLLEREDKANLIFCSSKQENLKQYADMGIETHIIDFNNTDKLEEAFKNAEVVGLISMPFVGKKRMAAHKNALDACKKAGVKKIVYTSLCNAGDETNPAVERVDHLYTENYIKELGFDYIILRNSQYAEPMISNYFQFASMNQPLTNSMGNGHMANITRRDCGKALGFALLRNKEYDHATLNINGKKLLTIAEFVAIGDKVTGKNIGYKEIDDEANYKIFDSMGIPRHVEDIIEGVTPPFASDGMVTFNEAIRKEKFNVCTDDFKKLTGDDPVDIEYMFAHADDYQMFSK